MKILVRFLLAAVLSVTVTLAQFDTAEVLGTVRDSSGGILPKAAVTLTNLDTNIQLKTATDENGNYNFFNVKSGRYAITAELAGFTKFSTTDVVVNVNARQRVDINLQVGAMTETISVSGAASALETDTSEHGQVINTQQIVELPLNGRNYSDLALLTTNVHRSPLATSPTPREGAFNVNGMRSTYNNFMLDGVDNNAYGTSNQGFANQVSQPSPDAVAEFKVITNNYSAEYGRAGGAVINVATRTGTNQFHGTVYEFLRNTRLNAIGYIFGQRPATFQKPTLQRNQFGATIGGPLIKDRVFFFGDYEGFRELAKTLSFASIPSLSDRAGILPVAVVNPLTGKIYPANTAIPAADVSAFALKVLNELPGPTGPGRSNNFQQSRLDRNYNDKFDGRIDGQINSRMTSFFRVSQRKLNVFNQPDITGPSGGGGNGFTRVLNQAAALAYTWTVTPSSILEARLGVSRTNAGKQPPFLGGPSMLAAYGITGLSTSPQLTGGLTAQNLNGFSGLGRQATNPQFQNPLLWDPKVNYSWIVGRHALKTGYEFQTIRTQVMDINPLYGRDTYNGGFTRTSGGPADAASYGLADFLFGLRSQYALANYVVGNYRQHQHFLYLQDDFRVSSKLTLNMGLRWEYATPRWDRDNNLTNFDPATNKLIQAKDGGIADRALVNPDYKNFGPRIGLAYSLTPKTVFRSGYGISYVHNNRVGSADLLGINGPQVVIATIDQTALLGNGQVNPNFRTTQQGYPAGLTDPSNFNPILSNIAYIPRDLKWPYVQTWFFAVQQEVAKNTVVELAYTGNHSLRLPIVADYNQALPNQPGGSLGIQARRPNQAFGPITWFNPAGSGTYNGLSVKLERRFSAGFYFLNSFTWSKALGTSEQQLETPAGVTVANPQNVRNLKLERGPSSYDVKFINVTSVVYQLPFGKGRRFGSSMPGVVDAVLGGWELTGINTANTGEPVNVIFNPSSTIDNTGRISDFRGATTFRPNLTGDPAGSSGPAMLDNYFNKAAFGLPGVDQPYGNLSRNAFRGANFEQWDLGVNKNFKIHESVALQFRSEFFNVLNHTNFRPPEPNFSSAAFGTIRSTYIPRQI
ncbi:MAG TPA: carboxypeptidase regulatory-like domain-containing protein, partial [Bryobacteraceae bacterium]|nr:carboxypeptidase regulatory-like domain-containing protein [Bryobacteraceae bacterium]